MHLYSSDNIVSHIQNIIHKDTQLHSHRLDLTVESIHRYVSPGSLDFGGSEFQPADATLTDPQKTSEDDEYGWWELEPGHYKAAFNEEITLGDNMAAIITPHDHACRAGLTANTILLMSGDTSVLTFQVPQTGCNIKENARFAAAYLFNTSS